MSGGASTSADGGLPQRRAAWTTNAFGGAFQSVEVEAAFWEWMTPVATRFDVATATLNGFMFCAAVVQMTRKGAQPEPFLVAATISFAVAAVAARGWPSSRVRIAALAATRVSSAMGMCAAAWFRVPSLDQIPLQWRQTPGANTPPLWAVLKTPRTHALALPALGFMMPTREHVLASIVSLAIIVSAHRSTVVAREAYFGRAPHAAVGRAFSAATRALFNPLGPRPPPMSDARVTLFVCWAVHIAAGLIAPFIVSRAWLRGARARFRAQAGPPKPAPPGELAPLLAHTATLDNATLGIAALVGASAGLWYALEWVDRWLG